MVNEKPMMVVGLSIGGMGVEVSMYRRGNKAALAYAWEGNPNESQIKRAEALVHRVIQEEYAGILFVEGNSVKVQTGEEEGEIEKSLSKHVGNVREDEEPS